MNKYYYDWGDRFKEVSRSVSSETESESSEGEEYLMVANRTCRQRKEVNYNFSEYDKLITTAINYDKKATAINDDKKDEPFPSKPTPRVNGGKDMSTILSANQLESSDEDESENTDVEEEEGVKGIGKDMANIEAALKDDKPDSPCKKLEDPSDIPEESENAGNKKKTKRKTSKRLNALSDDDDDEEDDTDEYQISEENSGSDESLHESELTDESMEYGRKYNKKNKRSKEDLRRSSRMRRERIDLAGFVNDDSNSEEEIKPRRGRRAKKASRYSKLSISDIEDEESYHSESSEDSDFKQQETK